MATMTQCDSTADYLVLERSRQIAAPSCEMCRVTAGKGDARLGWAIKAMVCEASTTQTQRQAEVLAGNARLRINDVQENARTRQVDDSTHARAHTYTHSRASTITLDAALIGWRCSPPVPVGAKQPTGWSPRASSATTAQPTSVGGRRRGRESTAPRRRKRWGSSRR